MQETKRFLQNEIWTWNISVSERFAFKPLEGVCKSSTDQRQVVWVATPPSVLSRELGNLNSF